MLFQWVPVAAVLLLSLGLPAANPAAPRPRPVAPAAPDSGADSPLLDSLLCSNPRLLPVVSQASKYGLQIIYTQINRDPQNQPRFTQHSFHLNARQYFNPASLVKLPVAALALEKLNRLQLPGLTRRSPMATGTAFRCQTPVPYVATADSDRLNTVGNYVKRMLLVSDNSAYNRLYELLGQRPLNERLAQLGYGTARITRRFAPCDTAANRHTNPVTFYNKQGAVIYEQPPAFNAQPLSFPLGRITQGHAYRAGGQLINQPYDFTTANYLPLEDVTTMLKAIIFPRAVSTQARFVLTADDYSFLRHYLESAPHAAAFRPFAGSQYFDTYKKYLYYGRNPGITLQSGLHMYNVVGMSHGYLADVAYFADFAKGTEFMLSAVLYVNSDGIINDGAYEYATVGLPFLAQLGRTLYQYEAQRPYTARPNFKELMPGAAGR